MSVAELHNDWELRYSKPAERAEVDGKAADILRANYLMRAVAVPAGRHTVSFAYEPARFRAGTAASLAGGLAIALMVLLHFRARGNRTS